MSLRYVEALGITLLRRSEMGKRQKLAAGRAARGAGGMRFYKGTEMKGDE